MFDVVCVGLANPSIVVEVTDHPNRNQHTDYYFRYFTFATDAAIVAVTLASWGLKVKLICNTLGGDYFGKMYLDMLHSAGVICDISLVEDIQTPLGFVFSGNNDDRRWYEEKSKIWDSLLSADLSDIAKSKIIYTDWYAEEGALRACRFAFRNNIPVFLNIGRSGLKSPIINDLLHFSSYCQGYYNMRGNINSWIHATHELSRNINNKNAILTSSSFGAISVANDKGVKVTPPTLDVIDTNGAGATFSAASIFSKLNNWDIDADLSFSCAAAMLKCQTRGVLKKDVNYILDVTRNLDVEQL